MEKQVKIFPLRLHPEKHSIIKESADQAGKSMHQFILDSTMKNADVYKLIRQAYDFVKGGPDSELENDLLNWLLNNR